MSTAIGYDSPSLISPPIVLRTYAREADECLRAERRYDAYAASLSASELADPSLGVSSRMEGLEAAYFRRVKFMTQAKEAALEAMERMGIRLGESVKLGGRLFVLTQDDDSDRPSIAVVNLSDVRDLGE